MRSLKTQDIFLQHTMELRFLIFQNYQHLKLYSNLVSKGSYIVVFDSTCGTFDKKNMDKGAKNYNYKPFGKKSNPLTAIYKFLKINKNFKIDDSFNNKALITNCLKGFLKKN